VASAQTPAAIVVRKKCDTDVGSGARARYQGVPSSTGFGNYHPASREAVGRQAPARFELPMAYVLRVTTGAGSFFLIVDSSGPALARVKEFKEIGCPVTIQDVHGIPIDESALLRVDTSSAVFVSSASTAADLRIRFP
jgi:hypothetical protein